MNKNILTGLYENKIPDDSSNSLWNDLCLHLPEMKHALSEGNKVFLEYKNDNKIIAELYQDNQLLDKMILSGKPKKSYFLITKGSNYSTIILVSSSISKKSIIGNDVHGDLLLSQNESSNAMLLDKNLAKEQSEVTATYMRLGNKRPVKISN